MKLSVSVSAQNIEELFKGLSKAVDADEVADEATAVILNRIRRRFLDEEGPHGEKWIPSKAGLRRRAKGGTGTLFRTGNLFHSIQAVRIGEGGRSIQTDVPYAYRHQHGVGQVKRAFLYFGDEDMQVVERLILKRIKEALK